MLTAPRRALAGALLVLSLLLPGYAGAGNDEEPDVAPLSLAELMLADGRYDRAMRILADVDLEPLSEAERFDVHRIRGMATLQQGDDVAALDHFEAAAAADPAQLVAHVLIAHAAYAMGDHQRVVDALHQAGEERDRLPSTAVLLARSLIELDRSADALSALDRARGRFPEESTLMREKALLFLRLQLYESANEAGLAYLDEALDDPYAYLTIGAAQRDAGQMESAAATFEDGLKACGDHPDLLVYAAHTYRDLQSPLASARMFERAWVLSGEHAFETAEQYRLADKTMQALRFNALVDDRGEQLKQRMSILLDAERFEEVAALHERLARHQLMDDDAYRYSLAYAYYRQGDHDTAEELLLGIASASYFDDAMQLRQAIAGCRERPGWCE